jgi:hypothetical protein
MKQSSSLMRLLIVSNLVLLCFTALVLFSSFDKPAGDERFNEITAERINIVNEDGTPVIVISNKQRIAAPVMEGKKYSMSVSEGREYMAGMIFFNEAGDEMGGLVFNSFKMPNGRVAGMGHLSFDRFRDNQVIALEYNENKSGVRTGLSFYDRPADGSFKKNLDLLEEANLKTTSPERLLEIKAVLKEMAEKKEQGVQRLFIGSRNEKAQLELKDKKGNVRGRFYIDDNGEAKLEFLDEKGEVSAVFPK